MIDFAKARATMVDNQIRPSGVTDRRLLAAMLSVPREEFVPEALRELAYIGEELPLKRGRALADPMALGKLIDLAGVQADDRILHIGCATGYGTAILARLGREVAAIEEDGELAAAAAANLARQGIANARVEQAPHSAGAEGLAPFDVVFIEGRIAQLPPALLGQLTETGRLVAVLGTGAAARAALWTKNGAAEGQVTAFAGSLPVLPGFAPSAPAFVF